MERDGTVLIFGRIWPYRGLDVLIRAEPSVSERVPQSGVVPVAYAAGKPVSPRST